jgi:F-type H+-transporting ATPase subunit b
MVGRALLLAALSISVLGWLAPSCPAWTGETPGPKEHAAEKAGHGQKDGHAPDKAGEHAPHEQKPIFTPPEQALDLAIWSLVVFLLLLFVLGKYAWKPMLEGLNRREQSIRAAVDEAKLAREETRRVQAEFQAKMDEAFAKIPKMMEDARRQAEQAREEMKNKALAEIQSERLRLRREVDTARDQALQQIWNQAAQLATLISAKAIGRSLTAEDQHRLNEEALNEVRQAGEKWQTELRQFGEEWHREGGG